MKRYTFYLFISALFSLRLLATNCPENIHDAVGTRCTEPGQYCGGEDCQKDGWCWLIYCSSEYVWVGVEAPPPANLTNLQVPLKGAEDAPLPEKPINTNSGNCNDEKVAFTYEQATPFGFSGQYLINMAKYRNVIISFPQSNSTTFGTIEISSQNHGNSQVVYNKHCSASPDGSKCLCGETLEVHVLLRINSLDGSFREEFETLLHTNEGQRERSDKRYFPGEYADLGFSFSLQELNGNYSERVEHTSNQWNFGGIFTNDGGFEGRIYHYDHGLLPLNPLAPTIIVGAYLSSY